MDAKRKRTGRKRKIGKRGRFKSLLIEGKNLAKCFLIIRYSAFCILHKSIDRSKKIWYRGIGDVGGRATDATTDGNGTFRAWKP